MLPEPGHSDRLCADLAARQHGVITVAQMQDAGLTNDAISRRRRNGRIHALTRGVYAWGHPRLGPLGPLWVAYLPTGAPPAPRAAPRAPLGRESAAWAWGILPPRRPLHVLARTNKRNRKGIEVHWCTTLTAA